MNKKLNKKIISYIGGSIISVAVVLLFVGMLAAPEISSYFKNRGSLSESDLKDRAIKKFSQYKIGPDDDSERDKFAELGNTKFPYSMNYSHFINSSVNDEQLYIYSQAQEDWILVSETKRTFDDKKLNEVSDWNLITP